MAQSGTLVTIDAGANTRYVRGTVIIHMGTIGSGEDYRLTFKQKSGWLLVSANIADNPGSGPLPDRQYPLGAKFSIIPTLTHDNGTVSKHLSERLSDGKYTETTGTLTTHVNT